MEKTGAIQPGVTPVTEEEQEQLVKQAVEAAQVGGKGRLDIRCACNRAIERLEDDAVSRLAKKCK